MKSHIPEFLIKYKHPCHNARIQEPGLGDTCLQPFFFSFSRALHLTAGLVNASDLLELLLSFNADVDAMNDDLCSPLFYATQSNNLYAASLLLNHGM